MLKKSMAAIGFAVILSSCSTVTIQPKDTAKMSSEPSYQDSKPFFLFGLIGDQHVDVKSICGSSKVSQMQSQQTFADGLLGAVTLGIYTPHSVKIWCQS